MGVEGEGGGIRLARDSFVIVLFEGVICIYKSDTIMAFVLAMGVWGWKISRTRRK